MCVFSTPSMARRSAPKPATPMRAPEPRLRAQSAAVSRSDTAVIAPATLAATYELIADTRAMLQSAGTDEDHRQYRPASVADKRTLLLSNGIAEGREALAQTPRGTRRSVSFMAAAEQSELDAAAAPPQLHQPRRLTAVRDDACGTFTLHEVMGAPPSSDNPSLGTAANALQSAAFRPATPVTEPETDDPVTVPAVEEGSALEEVHAEVGDEEFERSRQGPDTQAAAAPTDAAAAASGHAAATGAVHQPRGLPITAPPQAARRSRDQSRQTLAPRKASQARTRTRSRGMSVIEVVRSVTSASNAADATDQGRRRPSQTSGTLGNPREQVAVVTAPDSAGNAGGPEGHLLQRPPTPYYLDSRSALEHPGQPDTGATLAAPPVQNPASKPQQPEEQSQPLASPASAHTDARVQAAAGVAPASPSTLRGPEPGAGGRGGGGGGGGIGRYRPTPGPVPPQGGSYSPGGDRVRITMTAWTRVGFEVTLEMSVAVNIEGRVR